MKETRPISQRDFTTRTPDDMVRRVLFLAYLLSAPAGLAAIAAGVGRHQQPWTVAGAAAVVVALALHVTRRRWGAPAIIADTRTNLPFKPARVPKERVE